MRPVDVLRLSTRNFRTNRLRTFLTILAVSVATSAILFLVSFGYGLQLVTIQSIASSATVATIDVAPINQKSLVRLDDQAAARIAKVQNVVSVEPELDIEAQANLDSLGSVVVHAISAHYFELGDIRTEQGKIFSSEDTHTVVVSSGFLAQFNLNKSEATIGKQFSLTYNVGDTSISSAKQSVVKDEAPYTIVGVVADEDVSYLYAPLKDVRKIAPDATYANFKILALDRQNVLDVKEAINALGYDASAPLETLQQLDRVFTIVQLVLGALGVVALIISSIGMFNTMTISLLERTREIGIMKALGADRIDIWEMFLAEATIIGFCGGLMGVLMGIGLAFLANTGLNFLAGVYGGIQTTLFYSPPWFIFSIILFSTIVGGITGFYPARRASALNPLKALRYE